VPVNVPVVVTGEFVTVKIEGSARPTLVTVPPRPVAVNVVPLKLRPEPRVISLGAAALPVGLPMSVWLVSF
jgi:hypothetical protein